MTLLVCSTCQTGIPSEARHCPQCGPQSLTLILSDDSLHGMPGAETEVPQRLVRALGPEYQVVRLLGRGGFAEVYEVVDGDLQRRLAIKVLRPDIAWTAGMLARFKQEARAVARLNHPHTVPIHFVGEGEGLVFYAMPFVEGQSLADLLRDEGALDPARALNIAIPVLEALDHAHQHGLVHRDIKPDNVMIEVGAGRPLLLDFGISKSLDGGGTHTQTGFVVGTPLYMSPEQALGHRNIDARTDIYAFGAMLFQMLTGAPPFEGSTSQEIVGKHLSEPVPVPSNSDRRIPRWLSDVIVRCMAKQAADRYESAARVLEAIREGREQGSSGLITAARVVTRLAAPSAALPVEAPADTPVRPRSSVGVPALAHAETARMEVGTMPSRRPPRRWAGRFLTVAAGLAALAGGTAVALRPRPVLVVENRLLEPIVLSVNGDSARTIVPGDSVRARLPSGEPISADWWLVRPVEPSGRSLGEPVQGTIDLPAGDDARRYVDVGSLGGAYFAPLITNTSGRTLRVRITSGAGDSTGCDCVLPAGASAARLGYYRLTSESAISLTDSTGRTARFDRLADRVDRSSGVVTLQVAADDLVEPSPPRAAPRAGTRSSTGDRDDPAPRQDDPLRGIFPNR